MEYSEEKEGVEVKVIPAGIKVTREMIAAGVEAYLRLEPGEDSLERLVQDIFYAMCSELPQRERQELSSP